MVDRWLKGWADGLGDYRRRMFVQVAKSLSLWCACYVQLRSKVIVNVDVWGERTPSITCQNLLLHVHTMICRLVCFMLSTGTY